MPGYFLRVPSLPFPIRRLLLLFRGAVTNRNQPRIDRLRSIANPEPFLWAVLPHAARSFAPSILLLPEAAARQAAVGYLYARMLDTYEDLSATPEEAQQALAGFAARFESKVPGPAPASPTPDYIDARDETHLLLIDRHHLVDEVFLELAPESRSRIVGLVSDMASGMSQFSETFAQQGGVLHEEQQVLDYCHSVIGLPAIFVMQLLLGDVVDDHQQDAYEVSELIQLANITRDVEKDLRRGIAYHPALEPFLRAVSTPEVEVAINDARRDLMLLATRRAGAFRRLIDQVPLPRFSTARAAAVLMMLFTDRHYRRCAATVGVPTWSGPGRMATMVLTCLPALISSAWTSRILLRVERDLLAAA